MKVTNSVLKPSFDASCPRNLDESSVAAFLRRIGEHNEVELLRIRFDTIEFARPFGALYLASGLRRIVEDRRSRGVVTRRFGNLSTSAASYLGHVGFFRFLNIPHGNEPGQARGSETYLPITQINRSEYATNREVIESESDRLAEILCDGDTEMEAVGMLSYCFKEILRNAFDHTSVEHCNIMAQRWSDGRAEIAIVDEGPGVFKTLTKAYNPETPVAALELALLPGITSRSTDENEGFGLYMLSELGRLRGAFSILSDNVGLLVRKTGARAIAAPFQGTAVRLVLDASDCEFFPNQFARIQKSGEESMGCDPVPATSLSPSKVLHGIPTTYRGEARMKDEFATVLSSLHQKTKAGSVKWTENGPRGYEAIFGQGIVEAGYQTDTIDGGSDFMATLKNLSGKVIFYFHEDQEMLADLFEEARLSALDGRAVLSSFAEALEQGKQGTAAKNTPSDDADIPF